ncbi:uncharacterized protein LOC127856624 isoform X3 [Dreissena polymorpha]|uniref:uncharacterized protein LOC127856624 isoform X3 n=1 Tax=Dreissena polymorpha TaxID=45954 RepID=UPI0022641C5A|nr:uncharacterized protein LOC127856624 isoform X3 [Dreissena polymorpha]
MLLFELCLSLLKAAGVLCVLGISFSIGTYVLYKIYHKFFRPTFRRKPSITKNEDYPTTFKVPSKLPGWSYRGHNQYDSPTNKYGEHEVYTGETEMGNNESSLSSIPVYYRCGVVSINSPVKEEHLRQRKSRVVNQEKILKGNLDKHQVNRLVESQPLLGGDAVHVPESVENSRLQIRGQNLGLLRLKIDESGFVEDENVDENVEKLSNSLKGNFSPTSLCEKNLRLQSDDERLDLEVDTYMHQNLYEAEFGSSRNAEHLIVDNKYGASSVLLTPPSENDFSPKRLKSGQHSRQSTRSDISEIRSEIADLESIETFETDDDRDLSSSLPVDQPSQTVGDKGLCPRKLKRKLNEIANTSKSNNSSSCTSPEVSGPRPESVGGEKENSISGISSPELDLLYSEQSEVPIVYASTFNRIENDIHVVQDEFETISKDIQTLASKYSNSDKDPAAEILQEIFQRYPSIRLRQTERGIFLEKEPSSESRTTSETGDASIDLSWDLENIMDTIFSESLDPFPAGNLSQQQGDSVNVSSVDTSSISCPVDLDGSMYEDEFHLHLGTRVLPRIEERSELVSPVDGVDNRIALAPVMNNAVTSDLNGGVQGERLSDVDDTASETTPSDSDTYSTAPLASVSITNSDPINTGTGNLKIVTEKVETLDKESKTKLNVILNICDRVSIEEYADSEWRGDTPKACLMRQAYRAIPNHCRSCHLRRIRGDNYCGVRSAVVQTLISGLPPLNTWSSRDDAMQALASAYNYKSSGLRQWTFAKRRDFTTQNQLELMNKCLNTYYAKIEQMKEHSSNADKEQSLVDSLNSDPDCDLDLMEGVKLLMALSALRLHGDMEQGRNVPVFAWLLFARDTSESVAAFIKNHLNSVGNSGGLEQVEMCLLGYSLGVRIRVLRLSQFNEEDFVAYYPEDGTDSWPVVTLLAEDDRHYNIPVL